MNLEETGKLLALAALVDKRKLSTKSSLMWHSIIGDLDYNDAVLAVQDHFRHSTDYLLPAHVVAGVKLVRERRPPVPLSELEAGSVDHRSGLRAYVESLGIEWVEFEARRESGVTTFDAIDALTPTGDPT